MKKGPNIIEDFLDTLWQEFPTVRGMRYMMRNFNVDPNLSIHLYHFKRPARQLQQRRQKQGKVRVLGGNHTQNARVSAKRYFAKMGVPYR